MHHRLRRLLDRLGIYEYISYIRAGQSLIILTTLIFTIASCIYFLLQKEEYLSECEFTPPHLQDLPIQAGAAVIPGSAEDIAQVISYLTSEQVRSKIVRSFRLVERYEIEASTPRAKAKKINSLLDRNLYISRTKAQTIRIKTYDLNPDTAYLINLFLLQEAENFCRNIAKYEEHYNKSLSSLDSLRQEMRDLELKLSEFRYKYKVFTLSDAQEAPTQTAIQLMLRNPEALRQYDKVVSMETRLRRLQELYIRLYERVDEARVLLTTHPQLLIIVDPPYKTSFPERPRVLRNTVIGAGISLILSTFLVIYLGILGFWEEKPQKAEERELIPEKA